MEISEDLILTDAQYFWQFIQEVILPFEPHTNKPHSDFHKKLVHTACKPISATAAARGSLKSTLLAKYRPLHRLVCPTPNTTPIEKIEVLILSETSKLARDHLKWIKWQLLHNDVILSKFGKQADPNNLLWNEDEIELLNGNRCIALGYDSQVRGRHPTDIIVDDLESLNNMGGEESLSKLKDWFYRVLMGAMVPETRLTVIGTIIARKSLLSELVVKDGFAGRIWKALNEDSTGKAFSIWPERWSVDWLQERKKQLGVHRFNAEYQNEPVGVGDPIILPEWVKDRHTKEDLAGMHVIRRYIALDPAFTEERWGDYSAIIVLDEMEDGRLYERLAWRKKVGGPELIKTFMDFINYFKNVPDIRIGVEEVQAQKMIRQAITEKDPMMGGQIVSLRPDKDKVRRLIDVSRYFEMGIVSLSTEGLVEELINFPMMSRDRVDALVWALKLYEMNHPIINDQSFIEIDKLGHLRQCELDLYLDRMESGIPNHEASKEILNRRMEAIQIQQAMEDMMM